MEWVYRQPVRIEFGAGKREALGTVLAGLGAARCALVCDPYLVQTGIADAVAAKAGGRVAMIFSDVLPNPTVDNVNACAMALRNAKADAVVALGGGSCMDCAKAAAVIAPGTEPIETYHGTGVPLPQGGLPIIAMPTTAGTGSEVTAVSVLSNPNTGIKAPIVSDAFYPVVALIDPELTHSVPPRVMAQTGMDVLAHAMEGYMSRHHQPICDAVCIQAARLVVTHLEAACREPVDAAAREQMCVASVMAGLGFNLPKTGPSHACSFVLTTRYGLPHGEACALTLDGFTDIIARGEPERMAYFARQVGLPDVQALCTRIAALKKTLGLRTDLKEFALTQAALDDLVRDSRHPNMLNSPVEITDAMLYALYEGMR